MPYPKISCEEITKPGKEIYENKIRLLVEKTENIGKISSINVDTGKYEIGDDLIITSRKLQTKQPNPPIWAGRIPFNAVNSVGGTLIRTT
jgi:hypothetical protein